MARPYSDRFILGLQCADSSKPGVKLAKICVKYGISATEVSKKLCVSRVTIHSWFRGGEVRNKNKNNIEAFIKSLETRV